MKAKQDFTNKLQELIEEAEKNGVDVAIYAAQYMQNQAAQIQIRNTKVPIQPKRQIVPVFH